MEVGLGGFEKGAVRGEDTRGESCHVGEGVNEGAINLVEAFEDVDGGRTCRGVGEARVLDFKR